MGVGESAAPSLCPKAAKTNTCTNKEGLPQGRPSFYTVAFCLLHNDEVLRVFVENLTAVLGDKDQVLDADA